MDEDDDDLSIWLEVTKAIKPITGKKRVTPEPKKIKKVLPRQESHEITTPNVQHSPLPQKQVRKLRQQKFPIEAKLDLHGMVVIRAHQAVEVFLKNAIHNNLRCIEIITGKGDPALGRGQLRESLPVWLAMPGIKEHVLHIELNPVSRGGSYLVMLRRNNR